MGRRSFFSALIFCLLVTTAAQGQEGGLESLRETGKAFASIAQAVSPSVVYIQVETASPDGANIEVPSPFGEFWPFGNESFKRFFGDSLPGMPRRGPQGQRQVTGQGSGFVFSTDSGLLSDRTYLLTNNHVVENANRIRVQLQDGREFQAKIKGRDPQSDVAVIEIPVGDLPPLRLGDSSKLQVGEWVVAIGNPFGLNHTLTVGVVSATGRTTLGINDYEDFIQTDAAINPGNSGGPLVNLEGEVVGMNTAIFSQSGGYMGVGFAIPINLAKTIAQQLIERGEVTRGFLGIVIQPLTPDLAQSFDLERSDGILVAQVSEDSPAARGGLEPGDVIIGYQGKPVKNIGSFRNRVSLTPPGSKQSLTILRNGKQIELSVRIGTLTEEKLVAATGSAQRAEALGLTVQEMTPELAKALGVRPGPGVVVTDVEPGSAAAAAGIDVGTLILQVNRLPVNSVQELEQALAKRRDERSALLLIFKDGVQRFVAFNW